MRAMENIEYWFMLKELEELIGKRFEKMQEVKEEKFILKIGKERVVVELGKRMNIAFRIEEGSSENGFVKKTRKELKGFILRKIYQKNMDRIIVFEFEGKEGKKELIFEMFAKGNAVLVSEGTIIGVYKKESWSDREIKLRETYKFPKSNIVGNLREALSEKYIISSMMRLPLGKVYAKEVLRKLDIDEKTPGNKLKKEDIEKIEKEIEKLKNNFVPIGLSENPEKFKSLSEMIDEYYSREVEEKSQRILKLENRLEEQEKQLEELGKKENEYREIGDKIYEKYSEIEEILKKEKGKKEIEI